MSTLQDAIAFLVGNGATLAVGVSVVLLGGSLAMVMQRDPRARRSIGSWTAMGLCLYLVLALVPMTRWSLPEWSSPAAAPAPPPPAAALMGPLPETLAVEASETVGALIPEPDVSPALPQLDLAPGEPEPAPSSASTLTPELIAWVWLLGAALSTAWLLLGRLLLARLLRHSRSGPDDLAQAAELPRRARLRLLDRPIAPFCCGLFRPSVVLHASLTAPERRNQALAVLRHEGAHLRAGDLRVQALFACLLPVLWWHPLYWLVRAQVRFCAELLADAAAARSGVHGYVRELLDLAEDRALTGAAAPALSVFRRRSEFSRRIEMLLQRTLPWSPSPSFLRRCVQALATGAVVFASAGWFGIAPVAAQEPSGQGELRRQNQQLQEEIDRLRASLDALKTRIAQLAEPIPTQMQDGLNFLRKFQDLDSRVNVNAASERTVGALIRPDDEQIRNIIDFIKSQPSPQDPTQQPVTTKGSSSGQAGQGKANNLERTIRGQRAGRQSQDPLEQIVRNYKVKAGDSLDSIVRQVYGQGIDNALLLERVKALNPDLAPQNLRVGQEINLPAAAPAQDPFDPYRRSTAPAATGRTGDDAMSVLELATRAIQLRGEVELATAAMQHATELAKGGFTSAGEAQAAEIRLRTAKQTLAVAQRLVEAEIEAAKDEVRELKAALDTAKGEDAHRIERRFKLVSRRLEALVQAR